MDILYRDDELAVVNKPSGLLTHKSTWSGPADDAAVQQARDALGVHVWPVHRLDRQTSGALLFALSAEVAARMQEAFEAGLVEKRYLAIARGVVPGEVHVDHPIPRGEGKPRAPAVTDFRRVAVDALSRASLVEAFPRSGRFHQVRRHLAHLRHPIGGDSNYGTGWFNRFMRDEVGLPRLALHAASLRLPARSGEVLVSAPVPADLEGAIARLFGMGVDKSRV